MLSNVHLLEDVYLQCKSMLNGARHKFKLCGNMYAEIKLTPNTRRTACHFSMKIERVPKKNPRRLQILKLQRPQIVPGEIWFDIQLLGV